MPDHPANQANTGAERAADPEVEKSNRVVARQQSNTSANNLSDGNEEEHAPSFPYLFQ